MITFLTKIVEKVKSGTSSLNTCYFCKRKDSNHRYYKNESNKKIAVCPFCVEYAERRAFRKY